MYNSSNEVKLLLPDISDRLIDYVGIQPDIDDTRVKAACLVAQDLDVKKPLGSDNWDKCYEDTNGNEDVEYDSDLFDLIVPALCFFTYARLLNMMQLNVTNGGAMVEEEALSIGEVRAASKQYRAIGEAYLQEAVEYLQDDDPDTEATMDKSVLRVRSFGGRERPSYGSGTTNIYNTDTWLNRASYRSNLDFEE